MQKVNKFLSVVLTCLMLFSTTFMVTASAAKLGDVNGDSNVNSSDALLVLKHSVGSAKLDSDKQKKADVNGDGKINSSDALVILKISVGSYEGDLEEDDSVDEALPHIIFGNYIVSNGYQYGNQSNLYCINRTTYHNGGRSTTYIYYYKNTNKLEFVNIVHSSDDMVATTEVVYEPNKDLQTATNEVKVTSTFYLTGRGNVKASSITPDGCTISNFQCSNSKATSQVKGLLVDGIKLMFTDIAVVLESSGLDINMHDLGFTSWPVEEKVENNDSPVAANKAIVKYVTENGEREEGSNYCYVSHKDEENNVTTLIIYDLYEERLTFVQSISLDGSEMVSNTYLVFIPHMYKQVVAYKADYTTLPDITASGYIYTEDFSQNSNSVTDFECSNDKYYSEIKSLTENGLVLLLLGVNEWLKTTDLNITVNDLGFTSWESGVNNDDNTGDDDDNNFDDDNEDAVTPHDSLKNYVIKNGYHQSGSDYYLVSYEDYYEGQTLVTTVFYNVKDKELTFMQQISSYDSDVETISYLSYVPGASKQVVAYKADFASAPDITASGYIYTASFSPDGGTITGFECSNSNFNSEAKQLTEQGAVLLLFGMTDLLASTGLGITLADLGFTNWPY